MYFKEDVLSKIKLNSGFSPDMIEIIDGIIYIKVESRSIFNEN